MQIAQRQAMQFDSNENALGIELPIKNQLPRGIRIGLVAGQLVELAWSIGFFVYLIKIIQTIRGVLV